MTKKLWSGRFSTSTHPEVDQYTASILFDHELAYEDILGSLAHAGMLYHCGIISQSDCHKLQQGLTRLAEKIRVADVNFRLADEDIHMNIERLLSVTVGEAAGKLHTARSRNDQVALDLHLYVRKKLLTLVALLLRLQRIMLTLADHHQTVILPGYTHLQRAQPIYLGQHWLAYVAMFERDVARLIDSWPRVNQSPLGAAALTGTHFPIDRYYLADSLGFDDIYHNTLDAVSDRDFIIEFIATNAIIMMHISRLSEELVLWSSQEFNFISFADAYSTGSSIMPQKKNPDVAELGRGKTGRVYGALTSLLTMMKGLPLAYNKDMQEDKEPLFDVVKTVSQTISIYGSLLESITIHPDKMRAAVNDGYLNATALAEYLVRQGKTFRQAHEIVGRMVQYCLEKNKRLEDLSLEELQQFCPLIAENVYQVITLENTVAACHGSETTAPLAKQVEQVNQRIIDREKWLEEKNDLLVRVYKQFSLDYV